MTSSASIVINRLSVTALENYRRLVFRISNNDDMLILDGQDDLIQKIFNGLEALYFCPSYSLTAESALAVLLTSSESSTYLMGPVLSDQVDWLMELVSNALSFEYIQLMLQVTLCTYPHEKLHLYRSSMHASEGKEEIVQLEDISSSVIEMAPEKIWLLLLWGEWLQMTSLIQSCRKEIVTFLLPHNTIGNDSQSRDKLLFLNWPLSEDAIECTKIKLLQHFLDFGPSAKTVLSSSPPTTQSPTSNTLFPQGLSMKDLSSSGNHNQYQYSHRDQEEFHLHVPLPFMPPPPPLSSREDGATVHQKYINNFPVEERKHNSPGSITAIDQDDFFSPLSTTQNKFNHSSHKSDIQQTSVQNVSNHRNNQSYRQHKNRLEEDDDDTYTIDSWGTYADESSRLRSLRRRDQRSLQQVSTSQQRSVVENTTPQRISQLPTPIEPHHYPTPAPRSVSPSPIVSNRNSDNSGNIRVHDKQQSSSSNRASKTVHRPNRSVSPHSSHSSHSSVTKPVSISTTSAVAAPATSERLGDDKLALAREVALLRLRHVKIQQELEKSKLQAAQALKMTSLQSLALKSAVIRVASTSPGKSRATTPVKSFSPLSSHSRGEKQTMDLYEQARLQEAERQEMLLARARQRCVQRIQQKRADEKAKSAYETRQQQYKQSLQRQQREKNIVSAIHKQQQIPSIAPSVPETPVSTGVSRAASPGTAMKRVSFAANNSTPTMAKAKNGTAVAFEEDMLPTHPENHHRYSLAALHAVAAGVSPNKVSPTTASAASSSTLLGNSAQKLNWPSAAQLQQIKLQRQQQHRSSQSSSSPPAVVPSSDNLTLKPPKRDVSPPAIIKSSILRPSTSSMNSSDKQQHATPLSISNDLTLLRKKIGGKHSPPRSISDFDQNDDMHLVKQTDVVPPNDGDAPLNYKMDEYMIEVSLGEVSDLLDERCLGPVQQIYLLLKRSSQPLLEMHESVRSPSVNCRSQSHTGFLSADFQGMCIHFPVSSLPSLQKQVYNGNNNNNNEVGEEWENDEKLMLEIFAQQGSVADVCIARTEVNLSSLLMVQGMQQERMRIHWQKLVLYDPDRSDRIAGMMELAADAISLFA